MNAVQKVAKNTAVLTLAEVSTAVLGFFFTVCVATYLGADGFGVLSFALAFTAIMGMAADFGLRPLTIREVARNRALAPKLLGNVAGMKSVLAVAVLGLLALIINLMGYPQETVNVVYLMAFSVVLNSFAMMLYSIFEANERMEFVTIGQIMRSGLLLAGARYVIGADHGVTALAGVYVAAAAITLGYAIAVSAVRFARPSFKVDWLFWRHTLGQAWPFALVLMFSTLYYWIDSVMLSVMQGNEAVGWYSAAYKLVLFLLFIPGAYFHSVFPLMSRLFVASSDSLRLAYERSVKYMLFLGMPIGVGTTLLAGDVIALIFGPEYAASAVALRILIWSLAFIFVSGTIAQLFNALNRQRVVAAVTGGCALLNVSLNLVLIPRYSHVGASIATVATELAALGLLLAWGRTTPYRLPRRALVTDAARVVAAAGAMGVFVYFMRGEALWWLIPAAALLYFAALYGLRGVDETDRRLLRQMVGRRQTRGLQKQ